MKGILLSGFFVLAIVASQSNAFSIKKNPISKTFIRSSTTSENIVSPLDYKLQVQNNAKNLLKIGLDD